MRWGIYECWGRGGFGARVQSCSNPAVRIDGEGGDRKRSGDRSFVIFSILGMGKEWTRKGWRGGSWKKGGLGEWEVKKGRWDGKKRRGGK